MPQEQPKVVDDKWATSSQPSGEEKKDPFEDVPIVESGTGPVPQMAADEISQGHAQTAPDPLGSTALPQAPKAAVGGDAPVASAAVKPKAAAKQTATREGQGSS